MQKKKEKRARGRLLCGEALIRDTLPVCWSSSARQGSTPHHTPPTPCCGLLLHCFLLFPLCGGLASRPCFSPGIEHNQGGRAKEARATTAAPRSDGLGEPKKGRIFCAAAMRHTHGLSRPHTCTHFHAGDTHNKDVKEGRTLLERAHGWATGLASFPCPWLLRPRRILPLLRALSFCDRVAPAL